jgi:DNA repair exonuclease SbcCD ATPase subunit
MYPQPTTLFIFLALLGLTALFPSCTVYYTTSDIDNSLKTSVTKVNGNIESVLNQLTTLQGAFATIPCNHENEPFLTAHRLSSEVAQGQTELTTLQKSVNEAYQGFKGYTKGKEKISSGSIEWKQLKSTRKLVKKTFKTLQKKGDATIKKAYEFNAYINEYIVPKVQVCEVVSYVSQIQSQLPDPTKLTTEMNTQLQQYSQKIPDIETRWGSSHPGEISALKAELAKLKNVTGQPSQAIKTAQVSIDAFKAATQQIPKLYSCSPNWTLVSDLDQAMRKLQLDLTTIQSEVQQSVARMQSIINSLSQ